MNIHPICYFDMTDNELQQFMNISRRHPFTGKVNTLNLAITEQQLQHYQSGALAQDAFPNLNADEREFIISGILPGEWEALLGPEPVE